MVSFNFHQPQEFILVLKTFMNHIIYTIVTEMVKGQNLIREVAQAQAVVLEAAQVAVLAVAPAVEPVQDQLLNLKIPQK